MQNSPLTFHAHVMAPVSRDAAPKRQEPRNSMAFDLPRRRHRRVAQFSALTLTALFACGIAQTACAARSQPNLAPIGVATMETDGTIVLQLRATAPGVRGESRLTYPRTHEDYDAILTHLGGLRPGESKPVLPWPSKKN